LTSNQTTNSRESLTLSVRINTSCDISFLLATSLIHSKHVETRTSLLDLPAEVEMNFCSSAFTSNVLFCSHTQQFQQLPLRRGR